MKVVGKVVNNAFWLAAKMYNLVGDNLTTSNFKCQILKVLLILREYKEIWGDMYHYSLKTYVNCEK